jgi:UDP-glucuronate decarboxylase
LITGSGGFLGKVFVAFFKFLNETFLLKPCKLICIDNNIAYASEEDLPENGKIKYLAIDITDKKELKELPKIDLILNAAGLASPQTYKRFPFKTLDVSYLGTVNMAELTYEMNTQSFLAFSSSEVYSTPPPDKIPSKEDYIGNLLTNTERSCYDIGKTVLETLCVLYWKQKQVPVKIVRPFNIYGPGMFQNDFRVLPNFVNSILRNKPVKVYGYGYQTRTFCYITDAIVGFLRVLLLGKNGEIYNIGNNTPEVSINDLAKILRDTVAPNVKIENVSYPSSYPSTEPLRRCPCLEKAALEIGYKPTINLEEGLKRFYNWAKENYI